MNRNDISIYFTLLKCGTNKTNIKYSIIETFFLNIAPQQQAAK